MSIGLLPIMQHYAQDKDPAVRRHLCDALVAHGSPEAAELLLDLATQDSEEQVSAIATEQIDRLSPTQLKAVQPTVAQRFSPEKGKKHILNWVRCADRVAKGTHTSLFSGLGGWRQQVKATRKLNRRMLLSRKNEYSLGARLLNRYVLIAAILSFILAPLLFLLVVTNPDDELLIWAFTFTGLSILLAGIPLTVMFAPPTLAFRRSVIAYVDATTVVKFVGIPTLAIGLIIFALGESLDGEFFGPVILYLLVPLVLVRLSLNVATNIRHRLVYPLLLCLIALGVLVVVYSCMLWTLDVIDPWWYEYGNVMSGFLMVSVPMSLFMAIHQGSFGNKVMHTGESARSDFYNKVRWSSLAGLASVFIAVVTLAPGTGVEPPGGDETLQVALPETDGEAINAKRFQLMLAQGVETSVIHDAGQLMEQLEKEGGYRQLISYMEKMVSEIERGTSARQLTELADGLLDVVYSKDRASEIYDRFDRLVNQIYNLSDLLESAGPEGDSKSIPFNRSQSVAFEATGEGELELSVSAFRNGRSTDVVIWVNGVEFDNRTWSEPELFQGVIKAGTTWLVADVPARSVDLDGIMSHFHTKIAYVMNTYLFFNMDTRDTPSWEAIDLKFEVEVIWRPNVVPVEKKAGPSL